MIAGTLQKQRWSQTVSLLFQGVNSLVLLMSSFWFGNGALLGFYFLFPHLLPPDLHTCCVSTLTCDKHNRQRVPALPQLSSGGGTLSSTTAAFVSAWVRAESALLFPELSCSLFPSFCLCQSPCERCLCPVCLFILGSAQPPVSVWHPRVSLRFLALFPPPADIKCRLFADHQKHASAQLWREGTMLLCKGGVCSLLTLFGSRW